MYLSGIKEEGPGSLNPENQTRLVDALASFVFPTLYSVRMHTMQTLQVLRKSNITRTRGPVNTCSFFITDDASDMNGKK